MRLPLASSCVILGLSVACESGEKVKSEVQTEAQTYQGQIDLRVGEVSGEEAYLFGRIGGVAQDTLGRLYVTDWQANEIRVFSRTGKFLFRFGGDGEGPGELRGPCCLAFGPEGSLWVRESGNARYSAFVISSNRARFERSVSIHHSGANMWAPLTFDSQARLIDIGVRTDEEGKTELVRLHTSLSGTVDSSVVIPAPPSEEIGTFTVTRRLGDRVILFYLHQPFGPEQFVAHGPLGRWAEAVSSSYRIELHQTDGKILTIPGPDAPGPRLNEEESAEAAEEMNRDRKRLGLGSLPYGIPDRKPPLRSLFFDNAGRLWVELNLLDRRNREADVYGQDGSLEGHYIWPAEVRTGVTTWVEKTSLVGVAIDSLGVQRVVRVRFDANR